MLAVLPARSLPHAPARAAARRCRAGRKRRVGRGDGRRDARPVCQRAGAPPRTIGCVHGCSRCVGVGLGRVLLSFAQRWARSRRLVGKPVLIMGAGMVGAQVARRLEGHPEYGLAPIGFLDDEPRPLAEVGGRDVPVLGTAEDLEQTVVRTGVRHLIVAFSSVADERVSRLIQQCQELGVEVSVIPRMFDTINSRAGYDTVGGLPLIVVQRRRSEGRAVRDQARDRPPLRGDAAGGPLAGSPVRRCGSAPELVRAGAVCPTAGRSRRQGLRPLQVPLHVRRARARSNARRGHERAATSCSPATSRPAESRAPIGAPRWAVSCAAPRWMSCRSYSTSCAVR